MKPRPVAAWIAVPAVLGPLLVAAVAPQSDALFRAQPAAVASSAAITRAEIEAHVRWLAADERQGRVTGTSEAEACARYLADVFERSGLAPAGDEGTFLQKVPLVRTRATATPTLRFVDQEGDAEELVFGRDFDFRRAPRAGEGLDLVVAHSADELPAAADARVALFVDATSLDRRRWLEEAGLGDGGGFGLLLVPGSEREGEERGFSRRPSITRAGRAPQPAASVRVHGEALALLRSNRVRTVDVDSHVVSEAIVCSNVVARIAGVGTKASPGLAEEALVVTAHYDHIDGGHDVEPDPEADIVWNGADDDASGVAAVLEIAGAMAREKPPARTVLFVLVTGEEFGLLGTEEYLDHPVVPLERTVANLNFEMVGRPDETIGGAGHLWLTGWELTNLGPAFDERSLPIEPDPYPAERFYERSDNFAFVRRGVVGQTLSSFNLHTDYHQPSDEADTLDYEHLEDCTKAGLVAVRMIASGELTPAWSKNGEKRGPRR